jgi:hypothetical protein
MSSHGRSGGAPTKPKRATPTSKGKRNCNASYYYQRHDEPLPAAIDKAIEDWKAVVMRQKCYLDRAEMFVAGARMLAYAMGQACVDRGFESGQHRSKLAGGDIRVDLSEREVLTLAFLAHVGFENVIGWNGPKLAKFYNEQDAEHASEAIRVLERYRPNGALDKSDPSEPAFNRQSMIWDRWPRKKTGGAHT